MEILVVSKGLQPGDEVMIAKCDHEHLDDIMVFSKRANSTRVWRFHSDDNDIRHPINLVAGANWSLDKVRWPWEYCCAYKHIVAWRRS